MFLFVNFFFKLLSNMANNVCQGIYVPCHAHVVFPGLKFQLFVDEPSGLAT